MISVFPPRSQDTSDDSVPCFFTKDGRTCSGTKSKVTEFADFSLMIIGQLKERAKEALGIQNKEGRWLVSLTGFVFLKTSDLVCNPNSYTSG